jgi:hypothetical protein
MAGHSASKARLNALMPRPSTFCFIDLMVRPGLFSVIYISFFSAKKDVDARDKPGHD